MTRRELLLFVVAGVLLAAVGCVAWLHAIGAAAAAGSVAP